jgi:hypothetical protein
VRGVTHDKRSNLQLLPFSRDEAKTSPTAALSEKLADYRIVHFATHGLLDSARPELIGFALSLVDEKARVERALLLGRVYVTKRVEMNFVKAKGKRQKAKGKSSEPLFRPFLSMRYLAARIVYATFIFAFCLLPFAF